MSEFQPVAVSKPAAVQSITSPSKRLSVDDWAERSLANAPDEPVAPAGKPAKAKPAADAIVDDVLDQMYDDEPEQAESDDEPEVEREEEAPEEDDDADVDPRGSKDLPFKRSDLPKDKFIELKVDGKKVVVPVAELADGYVAQKTFHQRAQRLHEQSQQIQQIVESSRGEVTKVKTKVNELFSDPDALYELLVEKFEPVLNRVSRRYAESVREWKTDPRARPAHEARIEQKRIEAERNAVAAEREAHQRTQQEQFYIDQQVKVFKPGWENGLKAAGFPERTKELTDTVALFVRQKNEQGQMCDAKDIEAFVVRAAKVLGLKPAARVPPRPAQVLGRSRRSEGENGTRRSSKSKPSARQTSRGRDVDFFLPANMR